MNPSTTRVEGRLITTTGPVQGTIWFVPDMLWFKHGDDFEAVLGRHQLLRDGYFAVELTAARPGLQVSYDVICPVGHWKIKVESSDSTVQLSDLLAEQRH